MPDTSSSVINTALDTNIAELENTTDLVTKTNLKKYI